MKLLQSVPILTMGIVAVSGLMTMTLHFASNLEVPLLLFLANLVCLFIPLMIIAYLAARGYLIDGSGSRGGS